MNTEPEEWRQIADFPDYSISNHGRVRRDTVSEYAAGAMAKPGRILKPDINSVGYQRVMLYLDKRGHRKLVHRLVGAAFLPPPRPDQKEIAHNDGNRTHNFDSNLRWATRRENAHDTIAHGTVLRGEKSPNALVTEVDIPRIRQLRAAGVLRKDIANEYGVHTATIDAIVHGRNWRHVA